MTTERAGSAHLNAMIWRMRRQSPSLSRSAALRQQLGVSFRRQVVVGEYIVDFLAPAARLVVEVDGGYHRSRGHADARRDAALGRAGYRVLRLEAELVLTDLPAAVVTVTSYLQR